MSPAGLREPPCSARPAQSRELFPTGSPQRVVYNWGVSDSELVDRARQGDQSAFGELVRRHQGAVFRAALAALGSPEDAEEIAQDAFVAAYSNLEGFREEASFRTWVVAIAWRRAGPPARRRHLPAIRRASPPARPVVFP